MKSEHFLHSQVYSFFGIPLHKTTLQGACDFINAFIKDYKKDPVPRYVATTNIAFIHNTLGWVSTKNRELLDSLMNADLNVADGMPLVWLSHWLGYHFPMRVAGVDLVQKLAKQSHEQGLKLFFLGGKEGVADYAIENLKRDFPSMQVVGALSPNVNSDGSMNDEAVIDLLNQRKPDVLLLALGNPKQELWFRKYKEKIAIPVTIGVGGSLDFFSGNTKRAPKWMREIGLEWLFRLTQEPLRLFYRYLSSGLKFLWLTFPLLIIHSLLFLRKRFYHNTSLEWIEKKDEVKIVLPSDFSGEQVEELLEKWRSFLNKDVVIDFSNVQYIGPDGVSALLTIYRDQKRNKGYPINVMGLNQLIQSILYLHRLDFQPMKTPDGQG